jgi:hypothetical protein
VYLQVDVKGIGFLHPESYESKKDSLASGDLAGYPEAYVIPGSQENAWGYNTLGLMDRRLAEHTIQKVSQLSALGMRTEAFAGMYGIGKIRLEGAWVTVDEFKKRSIAQIRELIGKEQDSDRKEWFADMMKDLRENFEPVVLVRLMRSIFRVRDLLESDPKQVLAMIEEACQALSYEAEALGKKDHFDGTTPEGREAWAERVAFEVGKNVGIMHQAGMVHLFLHMGNLTLAGEVVDMDSVNPVVVEKVYRGKPEGRDHWLKTLEHAEKDDAGQIIRYGTHMSQAFARETTRGVAYINPDVGYYRTGDPEFGLPRCITKDIRDVCFSFRQLLKKMPSGLFGSRVDIKKRLAGALLKGYMQGLGDQETPLAIVGVTNARLHEVFAAIVQRVVEEGKHYAPIPPDSKDQEEDG